MRLSRTLIRCPFLIGVMMPLILIGCSRPVVKPVTSPPAESNTSQNAKPLNPAQVIGKVKGSGWYLPWYARDPKHPNGPPIPVLIANADTGEITNHNDNPVIVLHRVHAKLYQKGQHAANVVAAQVTANQQDQVIVGKGGCTVTSLLNPADTVLTADTITWDSDNTKFIAQGHARVVRRPLHGVPMTHEGGKIIYDLEKNTIDVE